MEAKDSPCGKKWMKVTLGHPRFLGTRKLAVFGAGIGSSSFWLPCFFTAFDDNIPGPMSPTPPILPPMVEVVDRKKIIRH